MARTKDRSGTQAGFSMVEFLMVAAIMAIGLLGVASMQVMAIKAGSGSTNLSTATSIGNRILDQIEEEGRLTWLNQTSSIYATAGTQPPHLYYFSNTVPFSISFTTNNDLKFDLQGTPWTATSGPVVFQAVITAGAAPQAVGGATIGRLADVTVVVNFTDTVSRGSAITRSVSLSRRIVYA